jgi:hypothetical protein
VSTPLWQSGQSAALVVAIGLLGGLLVAATVTAPTDLALLRPVGQVDRSVARTRSPVNPSPGGTRGWRGDVRLTAEAFDAGGAHRCPVVVALHSWTDTW